MFEIHDCSTWAGPVVVGERIHKVRLHERLTREEFCDMIYTNLDYYTKWRSGKRYPPMAYIYEMMEAFDLTAQDLLDVHSRIDDWKASVSAVTYWCDTDASERIKEWMDKKGITKRQLTMAIGVSSQTVQNWLAGSNRPNKGATEQLARFFGVTVGELTRPDWLRKD